MPKVSIPPLLHAKHALKPQKWYIIHDPGPRLILCLDELPRSTRPAAEGMVVYDPAKSAIDIIPEGKIFPVQEVEVEINVI